ncbi:hypothetical protein GCM10010187_08360 [Actinomadura coerulea]|nr:hypothetical protein GCM10010187_08360 [Actinomadura coerulea]
MVIPRRHRHHESLPIRGALASGFFDGPQVRGYVLSAGSKNVNVGYDYDPATLRMTLSLPKTGVPAQDRAQHGDAS